MLPCQARVYFARPLVNRLAVAPSPLAGPPAHTSLDGAAGEKMRPKKNGPLQYLAIVLPATPSDAPAGSLFASFVLPPTPPPKTSPKLSGRSTPATHQPMPAWFRIGHAVLADDGIAPRETGQGLLDENRC
ncbi:hypothetical protein IAQ61_004851 [Plenodomus lingam]|uniref:uncharacterized protein n=1 Tax=Leptosphaeria maculans TaxID=5022 RepID=UPI00332DB353|nr:hypothetical protein IAQ61_004851 [Plenodomus lingam]